MRKSHKPPRHHCPKGPSIVELAKKLGIPESGINGYAAMLSQWHREGCPLREQDEIDWIHDTLCKPCEHYVLTCSFGKCGRKACAKRKLEVDLQYVLPMETACCPTHKF